MEAVLTTREIAARYNYSPATIRRWIRTGLLPAQRVGPRQFRVSEADLLLLTQPAPRDGGGDAHP